VNAAVFLGDAVTGAGYRLAGADVRVPTVDDIDREFRRALQDSDFVILTTGCAAMLPPAAINEAVRHADPLVLVVPDAVQRLEPPDFEKVVARTLGISS
jgi:vacuolar-type H+-ATPase subunit F/Vma7